LSKNFLWQLNILQSVEPTRASQRLATCQLATGHWQLATASN
jgi:hypothetical protein